MKRCFLAVTTGLFLLSLCTSAPSAEAGGVSAELADLVTRIKARLKEGVKTEAGLATEIKEFDALVQKHKAEKTDEVASVLTSKAMLYFQIFDETDVPIKCAKQIKQDFPGTKSAKDADELLAHFESQAPVKAIMRSLHEGKPFPDFQEKDLEGKPLSISAYKGKVLLVDFWATWCGPCMRELPNVIDAYQKHHAKGFEIVGINLDTDDQKLRSFLKSKEMNWQQFSDLKKWENKLVQKYGVQSIPATFLLDRQGKIIGRDLTGAELDVAVSKALSAQKAS